DRDGLVPVGAAVGGAGGDARPGRQPGHAAAVEDAPDVPDVTAERSVRGSVIPARAVITDSGSVAATGLLAEADGRENPAAYPLFLPGTASPAPIPRRARGS
ncbi:hypothetical protein ACFT9I_36240, partial [Streptomyces sp. NPDC057137]